MAEKPKPAGPGRKSADANFSSSREEIAKRNEAVQREARKTRDEREAQEAAAKRRRDRL